ncbi:MAG: hypothetical protein JNK57_08685 [Planctomycetaceae bacterium]|nr:hypothetical protein [Planctomycetaceae bacterium]
MVKASFLLSILTGLLASDAASSSRSKPPRPVTLATTKVQVQTQSEQEQIVADARLFVSRELIDL